MSWKASLVIIGATSLCGVGAIAPGCATAPKSKAEKDLFVAEADSTLAKLRQQNWQLDSLIRKSSGYAVFPSVGKGGILVGGASGRGVVYEGGKPIGFVRLNQASIGAQLGAQSFTEVIVFQTKADLDRIKSGNFSLGASASAVVLSAGAAQALEFRDGVAVAIKPRGGLMVDLSVSGQQINFEGQEPVPRG